MTNNTNPTEGERVELEQCPNPWCVRGEILCPRVHWLGCRNVCVECASCGLQGPEFSTVILDDDGEVIDTQDAVELAVSAWNSRPALQADAGVTPTPEPAVEDQRLRMFLEILSAAGGQSDCSDWPGSWTNAFCEPHEGREPDTFNRACDLGYAHSTHDSDTDHSVVYLTEAGRAFLAATAPVGAALAAMPTPEPAPQGERVELLRVALQRIVDAWISNNNEGDDYEEGYDDGLKHCHDIAADALREAAIAAMPTPEPAPQGETVAVVTEIPMQRFAEAQPVRDEMNGEQTILTYSEDVGVWGLEFFESGWEFPDRWFGHSHWIDLTSMWPGVTAQVTEFYAHPATPPVGAGELDWRKIAKLAGEHGIRYRTNASLQAFLSAIAPTPPKASEGDER